MQYRLNLIFQNREILLDNIPNFLAVDFQVIMDQNISS